MKLINIPFIIITLSLITGILLGYYIDIDQSILVTTLVLSVLGLSVSWFLAQHIFRNSIPFTFFCVGVFIAIGIILVQIHDPTYQKEHYTNLLKNDQVSLGNSNAIQFTIKERLKPTAFYYKFAISIKILQEKKSKGIMLLLLPKNYTSILPKIGEEWIGIGILKPIPKPLNPDQFNYAAYLSKQYIYYQFTPNIDQLKKTKKIDKSIYQVADLIRSDIIKKLTSYDFTPKQLSIINALLLGQRQDIDQDTFVDYRDAGAIHLLAVSGLHVGVLMVIFNFLLKPLNRFRKRGKLLKTILVILLLWSFAVVAGLSPSVLRAVTMFSFLLIGLQIRSKISTYNSLITSLFVLLCFRPLLLFSVGFQLSYIAVFAILWIQPLIASYYTPRFKIDRILWETFTVTIAAQLGLLPLTLFYFHQFPTLFFVANLILIPVLGIILGMGILVIVLAELGFLPNVFAKVFAISIDGMNAIVHWVAEQDHLLISDITFSWRTLVISYVLIILLVTTLQKFNIQKMLAMGISIVGLLVLLIVEKEARFAKEELILFHNQRSTVLGIQQNGELHIYASDSISSQTQKYLFKNYLIENGSTLIANKALKNAYKFRDKSILIVDRSGMYPVSILRPDILILSGSPKIHMERIIKHLQPKQIIADGSNWKSYVTQWERTCTEQNIPFYRTDTFGAFFIK